MEDEENKVRQLKYYYRKKEGKPRFKVLALLAKKELGRELPSAKGILSLLFSRKEKKWLKEKLKITNMGLWKIERKVKDNKEPNLSFKTYKTLLDIAREEGILKERVDLEGILKEILQKRGKST